MEGLDLLFDEERAKLPIEPVPRIPITFIQGESTWTGFYTEKELFTIDRDFFSHVLNPSTFSDEGRRVELLPEENLDVVDMAMRVMLNKSVDVPSRKMYDVCLFLSRFAVGQSAMIYLLRNQYDTGIDIRIYELLHDSYMRKLVFTVYVSSKGKIDHDYLMTLDIDDMDHGFESYMKRNDISLKFVARFPLERIIECMQPRHMKKCWPLLRGKTIEWPPHQHECYKKHKMILAANRLRNMSTSQLAEYMNRCRLKTTSLSAFYDSPSASNPSKTYRQLADEQIAALRPNSGSTTEILLQTERIFHRCHLEDIYLSGLSALTIQEPQSMMELESIRNDEQALHPFLVPCDIEKTKQEIIDTLLAKKHK